MDSEQMKKIVEQYCRKGDVLSEDIKVTRVEDQKTVFVEQSGDNNGRAIILTEYKVDGTTYWAGYSSRSQTIYISQAARRVSK
jgi:hypothetical protein